MRKIFTLAAAALCVASATAAVETPLYWTENFREMAADNDFVVAPWTTYGTDAEPVEATKPYFVQDGVNHPYVLLQVGATSIPMANTNFADNSAANAWLISPEIEVPSDLAEFHWTAGVYCASGSLGTTRNTYEIRVSESGVEKEDFGEPIYTGSVTGSASVDLRTVSPVCRLNGYGGKKIHIAFVATGQNAGMIGFTNLELGNYAIYVDNQTPTFAQPGEEVTIVCNVGLKAPADCPTLKAVLEVDGQEPVELTYSKAFGRETGESLIYQLVSFKDYKITIPDTKVAYKLTLTPGFEGATPTVVTGVIAVPVVTYPNNVVTEELTATGCGWCPRGIAALEYFAEAYPGGNGNGKAINIAVHSNMNYADPMNEGIASTYLSFLEEINGTSLPNACFNRVYIQKDPTALSFFELEAKKRSNQKARITRVECPEDLQLGDKLTVSYDVYCGYETTESNLKAAVVLVENGVHGSESGYVQTNYFYNWDESTIVTNYGSWLVPDLLPFTTKGQYIPGKDMVYNHVARCIAPSFAGQDISSAHAVDVPVNFSTEVVVPEYVQDPKNLEAIVLVTDDTGAIVASDILPAEKFNTGVKETLAGSDISVSRNGRFVAVNAPEGADIAVYTLDGVKVASANAGAVETLLSADGLVIVKVATASAVKTVKLF